MVLWRMERGAEPSKGFGRRRLGDEAPRGERFVNVSYGHAARYSIHVARPTGFGLRE
jgi:hypothetical protein